MEQAFKSTRVLLPDGLKAATVVVRDGRIAEVRTGTRADGIDLGSAVLMPGIVDTHAHINEPGRTDWEGFATATRAAAAGGITTVVDMPLNSIPPTTTLAAMRAKASAAEGQCAIDYAFWGGIVPGNAAELEPMVRAGIMGFKCFLIDSGVDEFPMSDERTLREAMPILARLGVPLLVHAELESPTGARTGRTYESYLASRPQRWEVDAIRLVIGLARETGCRTHIVHLSAADALVDLSSARAAGVPITAETCPHYLAFEAEKIPDGATHFKCAPPIREHSNRERLWRAVASSEIEFIVSDHSPCTPALKRMEEGDFERAWGGIAGLQFSLPVIWSEMKKRGMTLAELSERMSARTARFLGLAGRKGSIVVGADADLVVWNPEATFSPTPDQVLHRHPITPYEGLTLHGVVEQTYVRGNLVYDRGRFPASPAGRWIGRNS